jgi:hypothetical protein
MTSAAPGTTGLELGRALRAAGLRWDPRPGDHFVVPDRDLDDTVFVLSHMVVEVIDTPVGPMLAFNGTTEWALDSVEVSEAVWLPLEHQLRELLGDDLVSLETVPSDDPATRGYAVTVRVGAEGGAGPGATAGGTERFVDVTAAAAYARAVVALSRR